jgi:hypothetical protein
LEKQEVNTLIQIQRKFSISPKPILVDDYSEQFTINKVYPVIGIKEVKYPDDEPVLLLLISDDNDDFQWIDRKLCWFHNVND